MARPSVAQAPGRSAASPDDSMQRAAESASDPGGFVLVVVAIVFVVYFVALHALLVDRTMPWLALAMIVAPWAVGFVALTAKLFEAAGGFRRVVIATVATAIAVAVVWMASARWTALVANADLVLYLENAVFFAWLSMLFAISLVASGEPLVTRMARKARRGDMPPEVVRYTRLVTIGWAVFFAAMIAISSFLYFEASRAAWSLFVNLLIWPSIVTAFVVEYAIRLTVLRNVHHVSLMTGMLAFRQRGSDRR